MRILRSSLLAGVVAIAGGCMASTGEYQARSAASTGCPADSITIENAKVTAKTSSWTAKCNGKTYYCGGDDMLRNVTCTEAKP